MARYATDVTYPHAAHIAASLEEGLKCLYLHRDRFSEALTCCNAGPQQSDRGAALLQGYAVKAGMLVGRGELLLFMDADGATRVSDVEKLEGALATLFDSGDAASIIMHSASGYATSEGRATHQLC